jgi:hypothetical protein
MKKIILKTLVLGIVLFSTLVFGGVIYAQDGTNTPATSASLVDTVGSQASIMQGTANLGEASIGSVVAGVIRAALGLLGLIFLIIIVFAGYRWMTASGNEEAIKKAQDSIKRGIIGLVIVILAFAITTFVFTQLPFDGLGATGSGVVGSH